LIVDEKIIHDDYNSTKHLPPEKALKYQLFYQMSRLTRDKGSLAHDDRLDVLAMAVQYWVDQMSRDVDDAMMSHKRDKLSQELNTFMNHALGNTGRGQDTWLTQNH
jgi:hypothetical protein